jgi:methyl-accepting chemotaxis protein
MKLLTDLRIEVKIIGIAVGISLFALLVGVIGLMNMAKINQMSAQIYQKELLGVSRIKEAYVNLICFARAEKNVMLSFAKKDKLRYVKIHDTNEAQFLSNVKAAASLLEAEQEKASLAKLENAWAEYRDVSKQVIALAAAENLNEARPSIELAMGPAREKINAVTDALEELTRMKEGNARRLSEEAAALYRSSRLVLLSIVTGGVLLGLTLGILLAVAIARPLKRVIARLFNTADQVGAASVEVSNASQSLAEGTSEQASSLEETSSSLDAMSSMTKQNADYTNQAKAMMSEAHQVVDKVDRHMKEMTGAVMEITKSSEETKKIVKTIDEIAFQTNLLALNAAVEAARAGEAGAGFAVVADEVRNLALRASEAAKNTSVLIEHTIRAVHKGNELTNATQEAFAENASIAGKIGHLVDEIAAASEEQSRRIAQVNIAVTEMDKVTQSTAANAEESAAAAEELSAQAEQMKGYVGDLVKVVGSGSSNDGGSDKEREGVSRREHAVALASSALPVQTGKSPAGRGKAS